MNSTKRKILTLSDKINIIDKIEKGVSRQTIGLPKSTISDIWKNKDTIKSQFALDQPSKKKIRKLQFESIDGALLDWFKIQRNRNIPLNGPILLLKAEEFGKSLGEHNFKASNGWLDKWKNRHDIIFRVVSGESAVVSDEKLDTWLRDKWPNLRGSYLEKDIFNCDETGLFFKMLPNGSLHFKKELCSGGKMSKDRITILFACNGDGTEKLKPLVISKSRNPRVFKNIKDRNSLPVLYFSNKNSWMTAEVI